MGVAQGINASLQVFVLLGELGDILGGHLSQPFPSQHGDIVNTWLSQLDKLIEPTL